MGMKSKGYKKGGMKTKGYSKGGMKTKGYSKGGMKSKGMAKDGMKTKGYSKGGRKQNSNDRLDERLGMKDGKEANKTQSYASRRNESRGESNPLSGFKNMGTMKNNWG